MKKYIILLLIFFIGCSSNKHITKDKKIEEFQVETSKLKPEMSVEVDNSSVIEVPKERKIEIPPEFKFTISPIDTFVLDEQNRLTLSIIGGGTADISLSWQDNSGNWKTVKNASKNEEVYNIFYNSDYVNTNIGKGKKIIKAEILYDRYKAPLILEKSIFIKNKVIKEIIKENIPNINLDLRSILYFDDIYFDVGQWKIPSYKLNSNYTIIIAKVVKVLKSDAEINLILSGHTDKSGSKAHNFAISQNRCETIEKMILDFFPSHEQEVVANRIFIKSEGANNLLIDTKNEVKNQLNRRVSINLSYQKLSNKISKSSSKVNFTRKVKSSNIDSEYKEALKLFYAKNYNEANIIFNNISTRYPNHKLSDNAKWWEGEILYVEKNFSKAIRIFNQVFGIGDGNKEAYAQYRIGCCYKEMDMPEKALIELRTVAKLYPGSKEECVKAKQLIGTIEK